MSLLLEVFIGLGSNALTGYFFYWKSKRDMLRLDKTLRRPTDPPPSQTLEKNP